MVRDLGLRRRYADARVEDVLEAAGLHALVAMAALPEQARLPGVVDEVADELRVVVDPDLPQAAEGRIAVGTAAEGREGVLPLPEAEEDAKRMEVRLVAGLVQHVVLVTVEREDRLLVADERLVILDDPSGDHAQQLAPTGLVGVLPADGSAVEGDQHVLIAGALLEERWEVLGVDRDALGPVVRRIDFDPAGLVRLGRAAAHERRDLQRCQAQHRRLDSHDFYLVFGSETLQKERAKCRPP